MEDEKKLKKARMVFDTVCATLDAKEFKYDKDEDELAVTYMVGGDDIPMLMVIRIDAERELVRLLSPVPAVFEGDKKIEGAIATCQANYNLADGSFDYGYKEGKVLFRMTSSFCDSLISGELLEYMMGCAAFTVDAYNDKFLMLALGKLSLEEFFKL